MINLVVALPPEAKPLIQEFGLKPAPDLAGFKRYANASMRLIICGLGRVNAASATAALGVATGGQNEVWLNLGIAGHGQMEVGTPVLGRALLLGGAALTWYPPLVIEAPCLGGSIMTLDRPETAYPQEHVYEMEAAGFYPTACRFTTGELVQVLKIISDNRKTPVETLSQGKISLLIEQNLPVIRELLDKLSELSASLPEPQLQDLMELNPGWRLSVTSKLQLQRLLERYSALGGGEEIAKRVRTSQSAKQALKILRTEVARLALDSGALVAADS